VRWNNVHGSDAKTPLRILHRMLHAQIDDVVFWVSRYDDSDAFRSRTMHQVSSGAALTEVGTRSELKNHADAVALIETHICG
jgi:hypothetical protein